MGLFLILPVISKIPHWFTWMIVGRVALHLKRCLTTCPTPPAPEPPWTCTSARVDAV
jgi:hypothetical protein